MKIRLDLNFLLLLTLLSMQSAYAAQDSETLTELTKADVLIRAGKYQSAYDLLIPLERKQAGNIEYDLMLGTAAVESAHYSQGMFALERVLAIEPDNQVARAKAAKAHFYLGEVENSKTEFNNILNQNPSQETAIAIEKYLSAIDKAMGLSSTLTAYLDVGAGWDSNVNSATSANSVAVPVFGGNSFPISDQARRQSTSFLDFSGGAGFRVPVTPSVAYIGNLQFSKKINQQHQEFETGAIDLNVGIQVKHDDSTYTLALQDGNFYVDDSKFRHAYGLTAQWQNNINLYNQAGLYGQYSRLEYMDNPIRDADRYIVGVNYAHAFQATHSPIVYFGTYIGRENATKSNTHFLDQDIYGLQAGGQLLVAPSWIAYASVGYESRNYQADDLAFLKKRQDDQYDLTLGLNYTPAHYWTIKPQISLIKNESNIDLYGFDRAMMSVNIRREFNW